MRMLVSNFQAAIATALREQQKADRVNGIESTYAAGLREILEASQRGERITIE